jgi:hypothetical protein
MKVEVYNGRIGAITNKCNFLTDIQHILPTTKLDQV